MSPPEQSPGRASKRAKTSVVGDRQSSGTAGNHVNDNHVHKDGDGLSSKLSFRSPNYRTPAKWRSLKQMLAAEQQQNVGRAIPLDHATYTSIQAPPSLLPRKKYCDLTGMPAKYTDPKTRLHYLGPTEFKLIREMGPAQVQARLEARGAHVVLK